VRWNVHGRRELYRSPWVTLTLVDVEASGRRYEHHAIEAPDAAGVVVSDPDRGVLLLWRHRFLGDEWAWEIPGGMVEPGEAPENAARRECVEESGWEPGQLRLLQRFRPIAGLSTQTFWIFGASSAREVGAPDPEEAARVAWVPHDEAGRLLDDHRVLDGMSVIALLLALRERGRD